MNNNRHPLDSSYAHSPPLLELEPPLKKHRKPIPTASMPSFDSAALPVRPVTIPSSRQQSDSLPTTQLQSCPPPLTYNTSSVLAPLYSLPEFKVGSVPHQPPPVWPLTMINEFMTPPSDRSFSLSEPSSDEDNHDNHQLVFDMDDI
ncbi:hypothetical protein BC941DRAFT_420808, partial [Chlamydoabsidia padenii]